MNTRQANICECGHPITTHHQHAEHLHGSCVGSDHWSRARQTQVLVDCSCEEYFPRYPAHATQWHEIRDFTFIASEAGSYFLDRTINHHIDNNAQIPVENIREYVETVQY